MFARVLSLAIGLAALAGCVAPQPPAPRPSLSVLQQARDLAAPAARWAAQCKDWDEWDKPAPPFRIHGDNYHVGTCGISAILIAGEEGHVLIDTATRAGAVVVLENIRNLGFHPENVAAVLTSHEHFDHVGGMWWVMQNTGAFVLTSPEAAEVIATGRSDPADPQHGMHQPMHPVARNLIQTVTSGDTETVAGHALAPLATPGHTPGALSWHWQSCEAGECLTIVYSDSLSPVSADLYRFSDQPEYLRAYHDGLARLAKLDCDILLTPHPSASLMRDKILAGSLRDGLSCADYAAKVEQRLDARLAKEAEQGQ